MAKILYKLFDELVSFSFYFRRGPSIYYKCWVLWRWRRRQFSHSPYQQARYPAPKQAFRAYFQASCPSWGHSQPLRLHQVRKFHQSSAFQWSSALLTIREILSLSFGCILHSYPVSIPLECQAWLRHRYPSWRHYRFDRPISGDIIEAEAL